MLQHNTSDGESADDESSNPETPHDSDEDTTGDSAQVGYIA